MREVPAKLFGFMREMSRRAGADVDGAQAGLALACVDTDAPHERVDWDEIATFFERAHGHLDRAEVERIGETYVDTQLWQGIVARVVGSPRVFYEVCFGILTPPSFPHLEIQVRSRRGGVRLELELPDRYRPSPFFFAGTTGEARAMTTLLGLPPAGVVADVGPRHGRYDISFEEPRAASDETDEVAREAIELLRRSVSAGLLEEEAAAPSVLALQRELGLTHTEARVAMRLAEGRTVEEIGRALGIRGSTVRSHLKAAYSKTGARGQAELVRLVLVGPRPR